MLEPFFLKVRDNVVPELNPLIEASFRGKAPASCIALVQAASPAKVRMQGDTVARAQQVFNVILSLTD